MNPIPNEINEARRLLIDAFDFDLYADPVFVERLLLLCRRFNIEQTHKQDQDDGVHSSGVTVEIKLSSVNMRKPSPTRNAVPTFLFDKLKGQSGKGIKAEIYLLTGYIQKDHRYFVIPAHRIERERIHIFLQERLYKNTGTWLDFEVKDSEVEEAITSRGKAYRELNNLNLGRL